MMNYSNELIAKMIRTIETVAFTIRSNTTLIGSVIEETNRLDAWKSLQKIEECATSLEEVKRECVKT